MTMIKGRLRKWGNSYGIIIPSEVVNEEKLKENQEIELLLIRDSREAFDKTFGILKGKIKKSAQEIKDELRRELYND